MIEIRKCLLTNNDCYKDAYRMSPVGIIVHSTGSNNPNLKRYVQPDDGLLGKNNYNNSWNKSGIDKCVHAMIGKDKNGDIRCYQLLPWNYCCWGIGRGSKGSYNFPKTTRHPNDRPFLQFEICEDSLKDENYFNKVMDMSQDLCAYWMKLYPSIKLTDVISHHEGYLRGMGSGHSDIDHWLKKFNKTMDWYRECVRKKYNELTTGNTGTETPASPSTPTTTNTGSTDSFTYTVVKGDTFSKIAAMFGTTTTVLKTANPQIKNINRISVGEKINIPSSCIPSGDFEAPNYFDKNIKKTFATTANLNMRKGAGTSNTRIVIIPKNTKVTCKGYYNKVSNSKWYLITATVKTKKYTGYVSSAYLK